LWKAEKPPGLIGNITEIGEATALADNVKEVAMFSRGGVAPLTRGPFPSLRSSEAHEHRTSRRIPDVADDPIAALASTA